jgi:kynurenine formamidase
MTAPDGFDELARHVRNWGRWGDDDQCGTLNHITPQSLRDAAAEVRSGRRFALGLAFDRFGPQGAAGPSKRFNPQLYVTETYGPLGTNGQEAYYADDVIHMPLQAATQWDSLAHVHYDGALYNDRPAATTYSTAGAAHNGIENLAGPGLMSRGVLLDIARLHDVDILPDQYPITIADLDAAAARQRVDVRPGDIVLIRTGRIRRFTIDRDRRAFTNAPPGLSYECARWIYDHDVAAVAADTVAVEVITAEIMAAERPLPLHLLCLRDMGCPLGEMFDLEALAADCADDGRSTFLLAASPLAVTGAVGSPVNPIALK